MIEENHVNEVIKACDMDRARLCFSASSFVAGRRASSFHNVDEAPSDVMMTKGHLRFAQRKFLKENVYSTGRTRKDSVILLAPQDGVSSPKKTHIWFDRSIFFFT